MEHNTPVYIVYARYRISLDILLWITATYQHDTYCCTFVKLYFSFVQITIGYAFKQISNIAFQSKHHTFRFRISHTAVVFNNHRLTLDIDKAKENKSFIVYIIFDKSFNGWANDTVFHFLHPFFCSERYRSDASHSTCIKTRIMFSYTFIVFCFRKNLVVFSITKNKYGTFYTTKKFFYNDRR